MTFGYPAPLMDSDEISQSVQDTAEDLLRKIVNDRGNVRSILSESVSCKLSHLQ